MPTTEEAVHALLNMVYDDLAGHIAVEIRSLINAGEPGVALEILVDNVLEDDIPISPAFRDDALRTAADMNLLRGDGRWEDLAKSGD